MTRRDTFWERVLRGTHEPAIWVDRIWHRNWWHSRSCDFCIVQGIPRNRFRRQTRRLLNPWRKVSPWVIVPITSGSSHGFASQVKCSCDQHKNEWTQKTKETKTHHWQLKATNLHTMTHKNRILRQTLKSGSTEDEKMEVPSTHGGKRPPVSVVSSLRMIVLTASLRRSQSVSGFKYSA